MNSKNQIHRRTFLKGLGAAVALPLLESMAPMKALAKAGAVTENGAPIRLAFMFVPNGVHLEDWTPTQVGANYELPYILEPLQRFKRDINVLSGLTHDKGRANGDGAGDHARSAGVFLTGAQPLKSEGASIRAGVSVDQFAAMQVGHETRFASIEIGTETGRQSGKCDSGYSCAYSNNISWRDEATPMTKETNPRLVFERLFGSDLKSEADLSRTKRLKYRKSILDFVMDDARRLNRNLGKTDQRKLDEYLSAVREIERRVESAEQLNGSKSRNVALNYDMPDGRPDTYEEHIRLMGDMMVLAFQADVTRISSFMLANAGSNRSYNFIDVKEGHHELSHHQGDKAKLEKISKINRFHVQQLAYILGRLKSIPEADGTLLDHTMIVYGSGISDGNRHNNENLPLLVAGGGGGAIRTGRHIRYDEETPVCNLFVSMLNGIGVQTDYFGDSTGPLRLLQG
jgi:hypothetical protein